MIVRVKLTENGALTEIDWRAADRVALALASYVKAAPASETAQFKYDTLIIPFIAAVLDRTIKVPFPFNDQPYDIRAQIEGTAPPLKKAFSELYADLVMRICGSPAASSLSTHETGHFILEECLEHDELGSSYELCWFEDDPADG